MNRILRNFFKLFLWIFYLSLFFFAAFVVVFSYYYFSTSNKNFAINFRSDVLSFPAQALFISNTSSEMCESLLLINGSPKDLTFCFVNFGVDVIVEFDRIGNNYDKWKYHESYTRCGWENKEQECSVGYGNWW